jgi:hypothetical protein
MDKTRNIQVKKERTTASINTHTKDLLKIVAAARKMTLEELMEELLQAGIKAAPSITFKDGKLVMDR